MALLQHKLRHRDPKNARPLEILTTCPPADSLREQLFEELSNANSDALVGEDPVLSERRRQLSCKLERLHMVKRVLKLL